MNDTIAIILGSAIILTGFTALGIVTVIVGNALTKWHSRG